ncbi:penicillin-binding protein 2 [Halarcobacter ebronensis]|uniref:Penicillin-binding protein 2 n=1 Tax=Halarcobacter ebronensis TaxID=1462615 RepID=A0A4Q1AZP2_9BACT|nr:penicillin-binding protein 2 [Halarcobacter ebronensis]QKF82268.1 penicillin-binding protein 2 [Halarcobacter ebronensis]RXK07698.1 penicillin-binding protein 2 [Halarcobacter ebronensis]
MKRLNLIFILILIVLITLLSRIYFLSIKSNTYYEELSKRNYIKKIYKVPNRGIIKDRNGVPLAMNKLGFSINLKPHLRSYKKREKLDELITLINNHFSQYSKEDLLKEYMKLDSNYKHDFVKIVEFIPYENFFDKYTIFNSNDDIEIKAEVKRVYPYGENASHIIGYVGKASKIDIENNEFSRYSDIIGKNGLEKYYNEKLQGKLGEKIVKVNALNKEIETLEETEAFTDNDLNISIDIRLQKYIQEIFGEDSGAVVVMNAKNGEILAAGSYPEFDNNIFVDGISIDEWNKLRNDFNHPFTNKLINGIYPPGSTIKMGIALSFLENGIKPNFEVYCSGSMQLGKRNFRCWKHDGHGRVGFKRAIRESCDDFFYKGSLQVGINKISESLKEYGIGVETGIDLGNEFYATNPNKEWKQEKYRQPWYLGDTINASIGQGYMTVTPMQIARYTAFIATGNLPKPHLAFDAYEAPKEITYRPSDLKLVQEGMYDVANNPNGTAYYHVRESNITLAAKTGTAQVVAIPQEEKKRMKESELKYYHRSHAWLTGYGPYKDPQYVVSIIVEHGGHGGSAAGHVMSKIFNKLEELGYIKNNK